MEKNSKNLQEQEHTNKMEERQRILWGVTKAIS